MPICQFLRHVKRVKAPRCILVWIRNVMSDAKNRVPWKYIFGWGAGKYICRSATCLTGNEDDSSWLTWRSDRRKSVFHEIGNCSAGVTYVVRQLSSNDPVWLAWHMPCLKFFKIPNIFLCANSNRNIVSLPQLFGIGIIAMHIYDREIRRLRDWSHSWQKSLG